jgi:hypothetical protein
MARFQERHPSIMAMYTRSCNIKRLEGVVSEKVQPFYNALSTLLATNKYLLRHIFNMDETGCAIGKVLVHKDRWQCRPSNLEANGSPWTSVSGQMVRY